MNLDEYINKYVKIDLTNGFYYQGKVLNVEGDFLVLIDKNRNRVTLNKSTIMLIREVTS